MPKFYIKRIEVDKVVRIYEVEAVNESDASERLYESDGDYDPDVTEFIETEVEEVAWVKSEADYVKSIRAAYGWGD